MLGCFRFTTVKNTRAGKKSCDFDEESKKSALKCVALSVYVRTIRLVRRPISSAAPPSSPTAWPPLICLARSCWSASKPRSSGEPFFISCLKSHASVVPDLFMAAVHLLVHERPVLPLQVQREAVHAALRSEMQCMALGTDGWVRTLTMPALLQPCQSAGSRASRVSTSSRVSRVNV